MQRFTLRAHIAALVMLFSVCSGPLHAQDAADRLVTAHLQAGEFGLALRAARDAPPQDRDRLLARVGLAQRRFTGGELALETLSAIQNDTLRSQAYGDYARTPVGARGGAGQPDFDTLIELITSTIAPQSWDEVGGPGAIDGFPTGVYVDAAGLLRRHPPKNSPDRELAEIRRAARDGSGGDARRASPLRKIALNRLENELEMRWARGEQPSETMRQLAGITRIQYVLLYPETGDLVLAGPAEDWRANAEGVMVGRDSGSPVVQLDDLLVLLHGAHAGDGRFGCRIVPRRDHLARTQAFLAESAKQPLKPHQRERWLKELRDTLGRQDIEIYGIDPTTRAARVIVEADYHMKLVGMGLAEGVPGVESYLDTVTDPGSMDVLRWWFTLKYDALQGTEDRLAFALRGPGVQVLSENEMLTARGERVHTGKSDELNSRFANSFTRHFELLAARYPLYADLRNIFDLALVAALLRSEGLPEQVDWRPGFLLRTDSAAVRRLRAPTEVETVINHRVIGGKQIIAGVSGGVTVDPRPLVQQAAIDFGPHAALDSTQRANQPPADLPPRNWWWD